VCVRWASVSRTRICPLDPKLTLPPKPACELPEVEVIVSMSGSCMKRAESRRTAASVVVSGVPVGNWTVQKIWPRSTAGMNSKPMKPSGIKEIAATVRTSAPPNTSQRQRSAPSNTRPA